MNNNLFENYTLQREELLARIAHELQLDSTRLKRMESAYEAVSNLLKKDKEFFADFEINLYSQGSARIGTTVKPINGGDFDLDAVLHIFEMYYNFSPDEIYNELKRALEKDSYYKTILEEKSRCLRLNYKGDFHMDILPGCMRIRFDNERMAIPEKDLRQWASSNPIGFANWFLEIANSVKESMLRTFAQSIIEAKVETEPLPLDLYNKTPLQRAVQLIKRYRDIYFQNRPYPVSSIVLTTLAAHYYDGESSIFDTISNGFLRVLTNYNLASSKGEKFKVYNPVDPEEEFTDSWTKAHYNSFFNFISDLYSKWESLKNSFETSQEDYIELFGEGIYKKSLQTQLRMFSNSAKDELTKANGLILTGNAHTDKAGQINCTKGIKNEPHHNYGE